MPYSHMHLYLYICRLVRLTSPNMNLIIALGVIVCNIGVFLFTYPHVSDEVLQVFCAVSFVQLDILYNK